MLKPFIFWTLVLFINTAWATGPNCSSILGNVTQGSLSNFQSHNLRRIDPQPWDVPEHGLIVEPHSLNGLETVQKTLSERDGTYPLIIDQEGTLVIDHRLPESSFSDLSAKAYVGNHLGLYNKLKTHNAGKAPKVFFAGQIRVVAGKVKNLIDQSGSFYFSPEDLGFAGENANQKLAKHNQQRLNIAFDLLAEMDITKESTEVKNFVESYARFEQPSDRQEGHVLAKDAAKFERFCRSNAACWSKHQTIESMLRKLHAIGNKSQITKYFLKNARENPVKNFEAVQLWVLVSTEGATELLSSPDALNPQTNRGSLIERFIKGFESIDLEEFQNFVSNL